MHVDDTTAHEGAGPRQGAATAVPASGRPTPAEPPYLGCHDPAEPVSSRQRVYLMTLLRDVDQDRPLTREERAEWASAVLEVDVTSFTELTYAQASRLIEAAVGWHMMSELLRQRLPSGPPPPPA